jgi:hypothetical protein
MFFPRAPVALFIFNRPDLTQEVFAAIRSAKPAQFFIVADAPRAGRDAEEKLCLEARAAVELIDWPCEVHRNYASTNMGCGRRVSSGIAWVFSQVDRAIFLEDDCLPDQSFFGYCDELLEHYKDDPQVGFVSGSNLFGLSGQDDASYFFSKYPLIWGWASWRRVWARYDFELRNWPAIRTSQWLATVTEPAEYDHWKKSFDAMHAGKIDTWDYQVTYMAFRQKFLCAIPRVNLISNIGFRADATHTKKRSNDANLATAALPLPLRHTAKVVASESFERAYVKHHTFSRLMPTLMRRARGLFSGT